MQIYNINNLPREALHRFGGGAVTQKLGGLAGSQDIYANIDILPPGAQSAKYHAHTLQEEFFLVLQGSGTLRTKEGKRPVKTGDFVAKPAGLENPHQFINTGDVPLYILDVGTNDLGDVAYYPDENVYLLRGEGTALSGAPNTAFTSEPDV